MADQSVYQVMYISASTGELSDHELKELLDQSRRSNAASGITGILLYCEGSIIQLLEGEKDKVEDLYHKIRNDPRHTRCIRLLGEYREKRDFPNWSMGFQLVKKSMNTEEGFCDAIEKRSLESLCLENISPRVRTLLLSFAKTNCLER